MGVRPEYNILVVDDDQNTVDALCRALELESYKARGVTSADQAINMLKHCRCDLIISDLLMPGLDGMALLDEMKRLRIETPVIICTGFGSIPSAVEAINRGAVDYLTKPVNLDQLMLVVKRTLQTSTLEKENRRLKEELRRSEGSREIIGRSRVMEDVMARIAAVAPTDATVLVRGESGTGKELAARAIHRLSHRSEGPLVTVNCAAFTDTLLESELFGHEKGAFTGAYKLSKGRVEMADGGTLFLDEIGDLSMSAQSKLLRLMQERTFERVGGNTSHSVDVRVIGATHRNLEQLIENGLFREDLYYRINVLQINLPPLKERTEDISLLFQEFISEFKLKYNKQHLETEREVLRLIERYDWPGNVRQLRNLAESIVIMNNNGRISPADLPESISGCNNTNDCRSLLDGTHSLAEIERAAIQKTLEYVGGNKSRAAIILGIGLKTLYRRLNEEESADEDDNPADALSD